MCFGAANHGPSRATSLTFVREMITRAARPAVRETVHFGDSGEGSEKFSNDGPSPCTVRSRGCLLLLDGPHHRNSVRRCVSENSAKSLSEKF